MPTSSEAMENAAKFLEDLGYTLDRWANESKVGGWSTHQVKSNITAAENCRQQASFLRQAILEESGLDVEKVRQMGNSRIIVMVARAATNFSPMLEALKVIRGHHCMSVPCKVCGEVADVAIRNAEKEI